ncbi:MAG TPA: DUF485 domain-containing protein [Baekduia sp.]|nr:DUF485 domain-containing protein [Baekduia sp.]
MSDDLPPADQRPVAPRLADRPQPEIDWSAIERDPDFQELVRRRRAFVVPATAFFLTWYMGFIVLTAVAPDFMGERIYEGLTVGYVLALTQFVMVLVLGIWYLRKSDRDFDPLAARVVERYGGSDLDARVAAAAEARQARFTSRRRRPATTTGEPRP